MLDVGEGAIGTQRADAISSMISALKSGFPIPAKTAHSIFQAAVKGGDEFIAMPAATQAQFTTPQSRRAMDAAKRNRGGGDASAQVFARAAELEAQGLSEEEAVAQAQKELGL